MMICIEDYTNINNNKCKFQTVQRSTVCVLNEFEPD